VSDGGRTVVVTGGSGQLGQAVVSRFVAGGDAVFVGYRSQRERADAVVASASAAGGRAFALELDLTSVESVNRAFREVERLAGPTDVLINNAAFRPIGRFLDLSEEDWGAVLGANLMGPVRCCKCVLPGMVERGSGRIINISGLDAIWGWGNRAHVTVSKAGMSGLTRAVAVEFSGLGITANTLVLGTFEVERDPQSYPNWEVSRRFLVDKTPVGRIGKPSEMAEWCWFLASDAAAWVTGQDVHLNGGAYPIVCNPLLGADHGDTD
jgi:3-oxoacyl-[acyl-carrier protein] reductase